jgi:hypothetical protein
LVQLTLTSFTNCITHANRSSTPARAGQARYRRYTSKMRAGRRMLPAGH